jgi:hypothetical protein
MPVVADHPVVAAMTALAGRRGPVLRDVRLMPVVPNEVARLKRIF